MTQRQVEVQIVDGVFQPDVEAPEAIATSRHRDPVSTDGKFLPIQRLQGAMMIHDE